MEPRRYKLDHVACGVRRIGDCIEYVEGTLGAEPYEIGPAGDFRFAQLTFGNGARLELLEPIPLQGGAGFMQRFLDSRGPGVHHVTFKVPSLSAAADAARACGYNVIGYDDSQPSWKEAFLHPREAQGLVVQLAESHPELSSFEPNPQDFPTVVEDRPGPMDLLGLLVSVHSEADAMHQWSEFLGGSVERQGSRMVFSWVDSPLRVWAEVDAERPPGPRSLLLAGHPSRDLGPSPQPELGIRVQHHD